MLKNFQSAHTCHPLRPGVPKLRHPPLRRLPLLGGSWVVVSRVIRGLGFLLRVVIE